MESDRDHKNLIKCVLLIRKDIGEILKEVSGGSIKCYFDYSMKPIIKNIVIKHLVFCILMRNAFAKDGVLRVSYSDPKNTVIFNF